MLNILKENKNIWIIRLPSKINIKRVCIYVNSFNMKKRSKNRLLSYFMIGGNRMAKKIVIDPGHPSKIKPSINRTSCSN